MKVSRINLDGQDIDIKDKNAMSKLAEGNQGDILVYDEETDTYLPLSSNEAIGLLSNLQDTNKPVSSSAVYKAINAMNTSFRSGVYSAFDELIVKFDYFSDTRILRAKVYSKEKYYTFDIKDKLDILVLSLNHEESGSSVTNIYNILDIITIDTTTMHMYVDEITSESDNPHYSGTIELPNDDINKILYFVILNPISDRGQIRKCETNTLTIGDSTSQTITVSTTDVGSYETQLNFTISEDVSYRVKLKVTICDGKYGERVRTQFVTFDPHQVTKTLNIGESGFYRKVITEPVFVSYLDNDIKITNPILTVNPRIPNYLLLVSCISKHIFVQVCINSDDIVSNFTHYTDISQYAEDLNINGGGILRIQVVNDLGSEPDVISFNLNGVGNTAEYWAEELNLNISDIPFIGKNIYNQTVIPSSFKMWIDSLEYPPATNKIKYDVINHQQFEVWIMNEDKYLVDTYEARYNPVKFNMN